MDKPEHLSEALQGGAVVASGPDVRQENPTASGPTLK